jgi:hypothetical protein
MPSIEELCRKFDSALQQWISIREATMQQIYNTIENLKYHHKNVNISRVTGSSTSIIGNVMAIWGIVMAPATGGLSLSLTVGGAALGFAGGMTSAGASIADILIQKSNVQQAQQQLTRDYEHLYAISALAIAIQSKIDEEHERQQCQDISTAELLVKLGLALTQGIFRVSNVGIKIAEVFATTFAAMKASGTVPTRVAFLESLGQLLGSLPGGALGSSILESLGGAIGSLLGRTVGKSLAPEAGGIAAARAGSKAVQGLAKAGVVLNVITIPFDLYEIVRSGSSLADGSETDAVKELTKIVEQLEQEKEAIAQIQRNRDQIVQKPAQE